MGSDSKQQIQRLIQGYLNLRFMFNENIQDTDNYVLIVLCRNHSISRNTHAHLPPVLWPPRLILLNQSYFKKIQLMNEINVHTIKYGNQHSWLSSYTACSSIFLKGEIIFQVLSMALGLFEYI